MVVLNGSVAPSWHEILPLWAALRIERFPPFPSGAA